VGWLEAQGYRVRTGKHVLARDGYLAGPDDDRLADLETMLRDPEVAAVWFSRGGYGTARLLGRIGWARFARKPKPLLGYSDATALFAAAVNRAGPTCLYAPVVSELGDAGAFHAGSLKRLLAGRPISMRLRRDQILSPGSARGPLVGGNLTVLNHLCGTKHAPRLDGAVLFLEDVGEPAYRVDRMLTQLEDAGWLRRVAGVLLGGLAVSPRRRFPPDRPLHAILAERLLGLGVPVAAGLPVGHLAGKWSLPLGSPVEIDGTARLLRFDP
jgi:muramoyltetrapeptide carboxypeptidase